MRPSVPRPGRGDYPRVTALLQYFSEITGYRKGVRQQLRAPPYAIPGLPSHAAMALRRPYPGEESELERSVTQTLITVPALALSPAAAEAHAPITVTHRETSAARLTAVDLFRGMAIIEVVAHHITSMALHRLEPGSPAHLVTAGINQTLHFAVPAFIFLSSTVLTRSLLRDFQLGRYYWRRTLRGLWPYVLWSTIYIVWYVLSGRRPPSVLSDPERWSFYLLYGKSSYHLYFMLVALQLYLVLPLLLPIARRRPSMRAALVVGFGLQLLAYTLNRVWWNFPYPASTLIWYVFPIILGLTVGSRLSEFRGWFQKYRYALFAALALIYPAYITVAYQYVLRVKVEAALHNGLSWLYSGLVALVLLGLSYRWQKVESRLRVAVASIGTVSLQVFLIHPMILQALEKTYSTKPGDDPALTLGLFALYGVIALVLPTLLGRLLMGSRVSLFLFGR